MIDAPPLLQVNNLSKSFGAVTALAGVSFSLHAGEVLGLVGQRGSGKSTLINLLSGVYPPSTGEILIDGKRAVFRLPLHAQQAGIETAHQYPELVESMNVLHNVFLGRESSRIEGLKVWPKEGEMLEEARRLFASFGVAPELIFEQPANLSNENRQVVALARAMCRSARLLLLDDPLPALSYQRQLKLLERIKDLAAHNTAVILSSDDLNHIFAVTDAVLVLYQGSPVALRQTSETTPREVVELVVGSNRREQVTPVIWAFENYYAAQQQAEELRQTQSELRQSLEAQDSLNRQLIERMRDQLKALDRLNLALQEANRRLNTEREAERKALARDLHDQVIQDLLSFNYSLETAENETPAGAQREELAKIREGIRQVVSSLRDLCSDLRPPTIDSHGLPAAIRSLAHQWSEQTGIAVELEIDPRLGRLPEPIELSVFRIIQEGLRNVRKHADASGVKLTLLRTPTASLVVQMSDNGKGVTGPINLARLSEQKHFGLLGISERVSLLGGRMKVKPAPKGGLELQIEIPSPYPSVKE